MKTRSLLHRGRMTGAVLLALSALFLSSWASVKPSVMGEAASEPVPLKVAVLGPLSGFLASFGTNQRDAAIMAFEEWNARGGVLGRTIEPVLGDSQCNSLAASAVVRKVIDEDKVNYIVGGVCSDESIAISQYANEKGVVQIASASTNAGVTVDQCGYVKPFTFRACYIDPFQGTVMAQFALNNLSADTAAVVVDLANQYTKVLADSFKAAFEAGGGDVVAWEAFEADDTDFAAILTRVKAANPDMFYIPTYFDKVNQIAAQAKQNGITATLLGGDGWDSPDLDLVAASGGYFCVAYHLDDPRSIAQDFVNRYRNRYGTVPSAISALAYDAANVLLQAIANAGVDDPATVKDALATSEFEAVSGNIAFDRFHNPVKNAAILRVQDGRVVFQTSFRPEPVPGPTPTPVVLCTPTATPTLRWLYLPIITRNYQR